MEYTKPLARLIEYFQKLPSIGPKTAQRLALHLIKMPEYEVENFANAMLNAKKTISYCEICFNMTTQSPCEICSNALRDKSTICVVSETKDLMAIEKTNEYKGLYHVLQGLISPMDGIGPDDIRVRELLNRVHENDIKVKVKNESDRLLERVGHFERKKERTIKENASDLKKNIAEVELKQTIGLKESNDTFVKAIEQVKDWQEFFAVRKEFLSSYKKVIKANFKELYPLLKEDLKQRKREAKIENKAYADQLKQEHEAKVVEITNNLETAKKELEEYQASLSEEAKHKINEIKEHNALAQKKLNKMKKGNQDINISKTSRNEDLEILKTGDEKFDSLEARVAELEKNLDDEKQDYINKTKITRAEAKRMALEVMREVGIPMPEKRFKQYPFEFSGGMRQRIVIAIALTANPDILICDEPTTALDVTIQAQILELINRLKRERHLSCIFITHDLGVVANMADRVAVMYAGKIVEYGLANEVFFDPRHPYTWALLSSIPDVDSKEKLEAIPGTPPDMLNPPKGDAFALRSKYAMAIDFKYEPPFFKITDTHYAATWLLYPGAPKVEMPKIVKTRIENALREQKEKEERGANQDGKTY